MGELVRVQRKRPETSERNRNQRIGVARSKNEHEAEAIDREVSRVNGPLLGAPAGELMDLQFGHDFSQVRVHGDGSAPEHDHIKVMNEHESGIDGAFPIPQELQRRYGASLDTDLTNVRLHKGSASAATAEALGARAYTIGQDIFFGRDQYDPSSFAGKHLIAHEVAHSVQQSQSLVTGDLQSKPSISNPEDAREREADDAANSMVEGAPAVVSNAPHGGLLIQRQSTMAPMSSGVTSAPVVKIMLQGEGDYTFSFAQAVKFIRGRMYIAANQWEQIEKRNEEQWVVSFWAEVLGGAKTPPGELFSLCLAALDQAHEAMQYGEEAIAEHYLQTSVEYYNLYSTALTRYQGSVEVGAERGIKITKMSIAILTAMATGGVSGFVATQTTSAAAQLALGAATSGIATAYTETMGQAGEILYGIRQEMEWGKIGTKALMDAATSFLTGGLGNVFFAKLTKSLPPADLARQEDLYKFFAGFGSKWLVAALKAVAEGNPMKGLSDEQCIDLVTSTLVAMLVAGPAKTEFTEYLQNRAAK